MGKLFKMPCVIIYRHNKLKSLSWIDFSCVFGLMSALGLDFENNHDLIYHAKCPEPTCINNYVGESICRITENKRS